jgi:cell division septal protein FtsQ
MAEEQRERPTTNQPLHGARRRLAPALLAVLGLVVAIVVVVLVITWLRYNT